jgi:1-acyl-sn-glycerol-3-phosphate acyltransferase
MSARTDDVGRASIPLPWTLINVVQAIYTGLWSAFCISAALLMLVLTFGRRVPLAMARRMWGPGLLKGAGAKLDLRGGVAATSKSYVFVSNHQSMIDIPVIFAALPVNIRFVLKQELKNVPFIGWYAWAMGMIFVDRRRRARSVLTLRAAAEKIKAGASIAAFPEGTRARDGQMKPFKKGVFDLAVAAGVPVVPVAIRGAVDVLPSDGFRVRPGTIHVAIGEPISSEGIEVDELAKIAHTKVVELYASLEAAS